MTTTKKSYGFRLSKQAGQHLNRIVALTGMNKTAAVELAVAQLSQSLTGDEMSNEQDVTNQLCLMRGSETILTGETMKNKFELQHVSRPQVSVKEEDWKHISWHASLKAAVRALRRNTAHLSPGTWDDHYRIIDPNGERVDPDYYNMICEKFPI